jgi:hypothetical protein
MDLNHELMREQIALHGLANAASSACRDHYRGAAQAIRDSIDSHFINRSGFRPVAA